MNRKNLLIALLICVEAVAAFATGKGALEIFSASDQLAVNNNNSAAVLTEGAVQEEGQAATFEPKQAVVNAAYITRIPEEFRKYDFNSDDYLSEMEMQQASKDYHAHHTNFSETEFARFIDFFFNQ